MRPPPVGTALTGKDKAQEEELRRLLGRNQFSSGGTSRDLSEEAKRGGPSAGDSVFVNSSSNPYAYSYLPKEIRSREDSLRSLEQALMMEKGGLMADPSGSGRFVSNGQGRGGVSRSGGAGITQSLGIPQGQGGQDYWRQDFEFGRQLGRQKQSGDQQISMDEKRMQMEQEIKMQMLSKLMASVGGNGGSSSGDGYTEQIFNNAGAPQVVRLKNRPAGQQSQILMQLLSGLR